MDVEWVPLPYDFKWLTEAQWCTSLHSGAILCVPRQLTGCLNGLSVIEGTMQKKHDSQ